MRRSRVELDQKAAYCSYCLNYELTKERNQNLMVLLS